MNEMENDDTETGRKPQAEKRLRKLSLKGISFAIEKLQRERSDACTQASKVKTKILELWTSNANVSVVQINLKRFKAHCERAASVHNTLLTDFSLPDEEQQRQNAWFQAKEDANSVFIDEVCTWLKENGILNKKDDGNGEHGESSVIVDNVNPEDSVSNVSSRGSSRRSLTSGSSTSNARKLAMAEQAALTEKAAALKRRHELEAQEERIRQEAEKLRKQKEQMELDALIAAAAARLSVLEGSDVGVKSSSNWMNSYASRGLKGQKFNLKAREFVPNPITAAQPSSTAPPFSFGPNVRPKMRIKSGEQDQLLHIKPLEKYDHLKPSTKIKDGPATLNFHSADVPQSMAAPVQPPVLHHHSSQSLGQQPNLLQTAAVTDNVICTIMQKQNEITTMLVQQQLAATLPQREIPVFDGNPLQCISFIRAFEHCVEERTSSYQDCLYFLEQYTRGQPRELVRSCMHMAPQQGYQRAKGLLKEHFGNEHQIATAYMEKVFTWPIIKSEDIQALQDFALFLRGCCNAMSEICYMEELNIPSHMRQVIMKWPYKLRERWRTMACELQERQGFRATFNDMVNFLEHQVKILSHPLFGDIADPQSSLAIKGGQRNRDPSKGNLTGSSFVTSIATTYCATASPPTVRRQPITTENLPSEACPYCEHAHSLIKCTELNRISQKEKVEFLKGK